MPEHDFEQHLARRLRDYSDDGVRPYDAVEIARTAIASGGHPAAATTAPRGLLPLWVRVLALSGLLVALLVGAAFAGGLIRLPTGIVEPSPTTSPLASPTTVAGPTPTMFQTLPPTPGPTNGPSPTPQPTPVAVGAWRAIQGFPAEGFGLVHDVTTGGPGFVAVGYIGDGFGNIVGAAAWTSFNGEQWTLHQPESLAGARLRHVVSTDDALFAIGAFPTGDPEDPFPERSAHVWRSTDGAEWELLPQPPVFAGPVVVDALLAFEGGLVAGGYRDDPARGPAVAMVWTSPDGITWTEATTPPDLYDVRDIASSQGVLLAFGNDPLSPPWRSLWTSVDGGATWQRADAPQLGSADAMLQAIGALDGRLVALGFHSQQEGIAALALNAIAGSPSWQGGRLDAYGMHAMERVVAIPGGLLAFGDLHGRVVEDCAPVPCDFIEPVGGRTWRSVDGVNWTAAGDFPATPGWWVAAIAAGPTGVVVFYGAEGLGWFAPFVEPGTEPTPGPSPSPSPSPSPTPTASPSPTPEPATGWRELTNFPAASRAQVNDVTFGGSGYVAVGSAGANGRIWFSADGVNWARASDSGVSPLQHVVYSGITFDYLAFAVSANQQTTQIWRSLDGRDWTALPVPAVLEFVADVAIGDGVVYAVGSDWDFDEARVWTSDDGGTWVDVGAPAAASELSAVAAHGGNIVVIAGGGFEGYGRRLYNRGPNTGGWERFDAFGEDVDGRLLDIASNGGQFVAVGYEDDFDSGRRAAVARMSFDGRDWTRTIVRDRDPLIFDQVVVLYHDASFLAIASSPMYSVADCQPVACIFLSEEGLTYTSGNGTDWRRGAQIYQREEEAPPETGDMIEHPRAVTSGQHGVVVADRWYDGLHVFFAPPDVYR